VLPSALSLSFDPEAGDVAERRKDAGSAIFPNASSSKKTEKASINSATEKAAAGRAISGKDGEGRGGGAAVEPWTQVLFLVQSHWGGAVLPGKDALLADGTGGLGGDLS
jgi:hypothetical protein